MAGMVACAHSAHDMYHFFSLLIGAKTSIIALVINFMAEMKRGEQKEEQTSMLNAAVSS